MSAECMWISAHVLLFLVMCVCVLALCESSKKERFAGDVSGAMVIVEPRAHVDLQRVLTNFDALGPPGYMIVLFHGRSHGAYAARAISGVQRPVLMLALQTDDLDAVAYSALLKSRAFWEAIPAEKILIFQTDTALCSRSPYTIQAFEHLPYVGASYTATGVGRNSHWGEHAFYGAGGLSFRKKSSMLRCIATRSAEAEGDLPEDVFFSDCIDDDLADATPTARHLSSFCTQNSFSRSSFGAHKVSLLQDRDKGAFTEYCPEAAFML